MRYYARQTVIGRGANRWIAAGRSDVALHLPDVMLIASKQISSAARCCRSGMLASDTQSRHGAR